MFEYIKVAEQVSESLCTPDDFDIDGIVREIQARGYTDVDDIDSDEYWDIIEMFAK